MASDSANRYVVMDLHGTLMNINSIIQLIPDWDEFHRASLKCPPNAPVVEFARRCQLHSEVIVVTGMPETLRLEVIGWLHTQGIHPEYLAMRPVMSVESDADLKPRLMEKILGRGWENRILFAVEDRDKMVDAWRRHGVTCFQCAESLY